MKTVFCNLGSLGLSISFTFSSNATCRPVLAAVSGKVSGIRLPKYDFSASPRYDVGSRLIIDATLAGRSISARFSGDVVTSDLLGDLDSFHWDFWRLSIATMSRALLSQGVVIFHAACIAKSGLLYLLPGSSGAGKSALSFFARSQGASVFASELCFVADGRLIAGNFLMSIDPEAMDVLGVPRLGDEGVLEGKLVCPTNADFSPRKIDRVVFPKASVAGDYLGRSISDRRTRMILYENAVGQLGVSQLISQQTRPVDLLPTREEVHSIALEVSKLSRVPALICEGPPARIWANL